VTQRKKVTVLLGGVLLVVLQILTPTALAGPSKSGMNNSEAKRGRSATRKPLEMSFVGDVILGRYRPAGYDPIPEKGKNPLDKVKAMLKSDLVVGNLETPLVYDLPKKSPSGKPYAFGAPKSLAKLLRAGGFDVLGLANNHAYDQKLAGMIQTPKILRELSIIPLGAANPEGATPKVETIERKGWKLGFISVTVHPSGPKKDGKWLTPMVLARKLVPTLKPLVQAARPTHDLLILTIHWGTEYEEEPKAYQTRAARKLIDAGLDLVIGHHPHVLQGMEYYKGGLIAYSLGNFLFENAYPIPRQTGVLRLTYERPRCLSKVQFRPAYIKSYPSKHPAPAPRGLARTIRKRLRKLSRALRRGKWKHVGKNLELRTKPCVEKR
jgi:hypothetical protein